MTIFRAGIDTATRQHAKLIVAGQSASVAAHPKAELMGQFARLMTPDLMAPLAEADLRAASFSGFRKKLADALRSTIADDVFFAAPFEDQEKLNKLSAELHHLRRPGSATRYTDTAYSRLTTASTVGAIVETALVATIAREPEPLTFEEMLSSRRIAVGYSLVNIGHFKGVFNDQVSTAHELDSHGRSTPYPYLRSPHVVRSDGDGLRFTTASSPHRTAQAYPRPIEPTSGCPVGLNPGSFKLLHEVVVTAAIENGLITPS